MHKILFFPVILALSIVNMDAFAAPNARRGAPVANNSASAAAPKTAARAASVRSAANPNAKASAKTQTLGNQKISGAGRVTSARAGTTKKVINSGTKVNEAQENTAVSQECQDAYYGCMDAFCMLDNTSGGRCLCSDRNAELDAVLEEILKLDQQSYTLATEGVERIQMGENADLIMARAKAAADNVSKQETIEIKGKEGTSSRKRTIVDLSMWNSTAFDSEDEDETDKIFDEAMRTAESDFAGKKGDELHSASAKLCTKQLPQQCMSSASFLQLAYAQKVKSDCSAYENSLRQQRNASQQKLQTAQKALRDAALEMYENENKYDLGQCVVEFKKCMQTTAECGEDFSGCIADTAILTALYGDAKSKIATTPIQTGTTKIVISSATRDILENKSLMCTSVTKQCVNANKKGEVWKTVIKDIAPAVYTAEYTAASNSRMSCITTAANCVKTVCGSQWDENTDNYDACLSDPDIPAASCKLELAKCSGNDESTPLSERVWGYVKAKLAAMRVDRCTTEVKECLTSEDRCGSDYANCIGLDTDTIVDLCAFEKLIACQEKFDTNTVRDYIARVAQGLALSIDNNFLQVCQNASDAAMTRVCGDTETCADLTLDERASTGSLKYSVCQLIVNSDGSMTMNNSACKDSVELITEQELGLDKLTASSLNRLSSKESGSSSFGFGYIGLLGIAGGGSSASQSRFNYISVPNYKLTEGQEVFYQPRISGTFDFNTSIAFGTNEKGKLAFVNEMKNPETDAEYLKQVCDYTTATGEEEGDIVVNIEETCKKEQKATYNIVQAVVDGMNNSLNKVMTAIETDPTVDKCMNGNDFQAIATTAERATGKTIRRGAKRSEENPDAGRFVNLTDGLRQIIASQIYNEALNAYNEKLAELETKRDEDYLALAAKYAAVAEKNDKIAQNQRKGTDCAALNRNNSTWNYREVVTTVYREDSQVCVKTTRTQTCKTTKNAGNPGRRTCTEWNAASETTQNIKM